MIKKRDGRVVPFDSSRIVNAMKKAYADVGESAPTQLSNQVTLIMGAAKAKTKRGEPVSVESIQDAVEERLVAVGKWEVARSYVRYRYKRELARNSRGELDKTLLEITAGANQEAKDENSNKDPTKAAVMRDYIAGTVSRDISIRKLFPDDCVKAHKAGSIWLHDLDYFIEPIFNCCVWDAADILKNGTVINGTKIETPRSFRTACTVLTQCAAVIASGQFGGQTFSLASLVPLINVSRKKIRNQVKDELGDGVSDFTINRITETRLREEVKDGVQTMQYQTLTLFSSNGQTPFISWWMPLLEFDTEQQRKDAAMMYEEVLKQRIQGVKNEKGEWVTPAFPKLLFELSTLTAHDGEYRYLTELAAKCTAKRMVPDYISAKVQYRLKYKGKLLPIAERREKWGSEKIWGENPFKELSEEQCAILDKYAVDMAEHLYEGAELGDVSDAERIIAEYGIPRNKVVPPTYPCMGCRSFLTPDLIHYKYFGRFNQGVVTLNVPFAAMLAVEKTLGGSQELRIATFWNELDAMLNVAHKALRVKHKRLIGTTTSISPIHWRHGALARFGVDDDITPLLFDNYSTISLGYAGLYEAMYVLTGKSHTDPSVTPLALETLKKLNDACAKWRSEENISYSVYGTPIESTTYSFAKALKRRFSELDVQEVKDVLSHDYITNSYHVNVREQIDPFTKLSLESKFQELTPGGAISYTEAGDMTRNIPALLSLMDFMYDTILYSEVNTKSDYCMECGYDGEIEIYRDPDTGRLGWRCPNCGNTDQRKMSVARRTCGGLTSPQYK